MVTSRESLRSARLSVRPARSRDASFIASVAIGADVRRLASLKRGFLLFPWSEAAYAVLADLSAGLCVCMLDGRPVGFINSFPANPLPHPVRRLLGAEGLALVSHLEIIAHAHADPRCQVVFQMALEPELQARGLGSGFFRFYRAQVAGPYFGIVLECPVLSVRAAFWRALGFKRVDSISFPTPSELLFLHAGAREDPATLTWGAYRAPSLASDAQPQQGRNP